MNKPKQCEVAKECGWSKNYISEILSGKKGCNKETMEIIKKYYPELKWKEKVKIRYYTSWEVQNER
jgi:transcriptional regulator with XRE-family HTH domain